SARFVGGAAPHWFAQVHHPLDIAAPADGVECGARRFAQEFDRLRDDGDIFLGQLEMRVNIEDNFTRGRFRAIRPSHTLMQVEDAFLRLNADGAIVARQIGRGLERVGSVSGANDRRNEPSADPNCAQHRWSSEQTGTYRANWTLSRQVTSGCRSGAIRADFAGCEPSDACVAEGHES